MNAERYAILRNNVKVYQCEDRIKTVQGDFLQLYPTLPRSNLVFLDPPWGGVDYTKKSEVNLSLSGVCIADVCFQLRKRTNYVVIKAPRNFGVQLFKKRLEERNKEDDKLTVILRERPIPLRKMLLLIIEIKKIKRTSNEENPKQVSQRHCEEQGLKRKRSRCDSNGDDDEDLSQTKMRRQ